MPSLVTLTYKFDLVAYTMSLFQLCARDTKLLMIHDVAQSTIVRHLAIFGGRLKGSPGNVPVYLSHWINRPTAPFPASQLEERNGDP